MAFGFRSEERAPLDELAKLVEKATPIPLTDQVRADRKKAFNLLERIEAVSPEGIAARAALQELFVQAKPVPLTKEVRFERPEAERLIDEIRRWK